MTKFELALQAAEQLPEDMRERLGDRMLRFIDKYLAMRDAIEIGVRELDAGLGIPAEVVFERLRTRYGV
jgi:hypothetical protein